MNDSSRTDLQSSGRSRLDASQELEKLILGSSEPISQIGSQNYHCWCLAGKATSPAVVPPRLLQSFLHPQA